MLVQEMHQNGILPRHKSIISPVFMLPEETIAETAAHWDKLSAFEVYALQVLLVMVTPQLQII